LQKNKVIQKLLYKLHLARDIDQLILKNKIDQRAIDESMEKIEQIRTMSGRLVVLIIPSSGMWRGTQCDVERTFYEMTRAALVRHRFEVVDVFPEFMRRGNPVQFYFATDPHWNAAGHLTAATALSEYLGANP